MKKTILLGVVTACLWFTITSITHAQTTKPHIDSLAKPENPPKLIRVQVEFIDVPHEELTAMMFGEKPAANDLELRERAADLVKGGKATILETMLCTARSGQKATSESIEEFIYPTEYEPAMIPDDAPPKTNEQGVLEVRKRIDFAVGPIPTAFETRYLGSTLAIEPTLDSSEKLIDLRFVPEIVYHVGNTVWAEWKGESGDTPVQMPTIYCVRLKTAVTLLDGKTMLVGALSPKNDKGFTDFSRKLMIFVRADVLTVGR